MGRNWFIKGDDKHKVDPVTGNAIFQKALRNAVGIMSPTAPMIIPSALNFRIVAGHGCEGTTFQFADSRVEGMGINEQMRNLKMMGTNEMSDECTMCYGLRRASAVETL